MSRIHRRLRALAFLFVLFPLWWMQRTHANPMSASSGGGHGHPAKNVTPGGAGPHADGGDGDDGGGSDGDDGGGHDGDDDDGHDGDDDDGGGGGGGGSVKAYCNGTGSQNGGVDCPCSNNAPTGPSGCVNSSGSGASLTATGSPSVSNDTLVLTATGIPSNHVGYFLFSQSSTGGTVFGDGVRCLGPFQRVHKVDHSSGSDVFPAPGSPPISTQLGITAGELTFFQVIYRDGAGPCHSGSNATNALSILWGT
jgi:hypothetical protein